MCQKTIKNLLRSRLFVHDLRYTGWAKNVALNFCLYFRQLLIDFQNSFLGTLCKQFAITWLLHISPHRKCVSTLACKISIKYAYITIITNKHFSKVEKKHFRPTLQWMVCMTLNCVGLTQFSVTQIIYRNVGLKCFFIYLNFCYCSFCLHLYFTR